MGTNIYIRNRSTVKQRLIKQENPEIHIAKNSCGWQLVFASITPEELAEAGLPQSATHLSSVISILNYIELHDIQIVDEYHYTMTLSEFMILILANLHEKSEYADTSPPNPKCFIDAAGHSFMSVDFC
jgi:hypothetical protein